MPVFIVDICRTGYAHKLVAITAKDESEATEIASDSSGDYEYTEHDAAYEIVSIQELK